MHSWHLVVADNHIKLLIGVQPLQGIGAGSHPLDDDAAFTAQNSGCQVDELLLIIDVEHSGGLGGALPDIL